MTVRVRNRITFIFFIITTIFLLLSAFVVAWQYFTGSLTIPETYIKDSGTNFLTKDNFFCVFIGIFFQLIYIAVTTNIIYHSFEKTQAPDIVYFLLFLASCFINATRLFVPLFHLSGTYSTILITEGNIQLFSYFLAPLALMGTVFFSSEQYRQKTDRYCIVLIILSIFVSKIIPLNSAVIFSNFRISNGLSKSIFAFSVIISVLCTLTLFLNNRKNECSQKITLGFSTMIIGYYIVFACSNIISAILGPILLCFGTAVYIREVHHHYLWLD